MRPLTVELAGFGSFREATTIDLRDADLFVLAGPTGAGKSLILESIVLALYGSVPRYDDRRLVAPVINQTAMSARVRLTFAVGGRTFEATRVIRRTDRGATTKEARLEETTDGGSRLLAGNAEELTTRVEGLLGLNFEQFTRAVVLPQGAFDRFLFAKPADRADLLVSLLGLGVHEQVGKRARALATHAAATADAAERRLTGELADATEEVRDRAGARVEALEALARRCAEAAPELDEIIEEGRARREVADRRRTERDALATLTEPDDLAALTADLAATEDRRRAAEAELAEATEQAEQAEAVITGLAPAETLREIVRLDTELAGADERIAERVAGAERAGASAADATATEARADQAVESARDALGHAQRGELAHTLAEGLDAGDDCPVCGAELSAAPELGDAPATTTAREALERARQQAAEARDARTRVDADAAAAGNAADEQRSHVGALRDERERQRASADLPTDPAAITDLLTEVEAAQARMEQARRGERTATTAAGAVRRDAQRLAERTRSAWADFDAARDRVAALEPPPVDREDLAGAWAALLAWGREHLPAATEAAQQAQRDVEESTARWRERDEALRRACAEAGVEVERGSQPAVAVEGALATARGELASCERRLELAGELRAGRDAAREGHQVAKALGEHLKAQGFERWLLHRALELLVVRASVLLRELTAGGYSLALDATNAFLVIDHREADEPRSARSLSGGERFLASLALALALADHVAELAAGGAARLESLFLDEGFGTLDADTLDTVTAALEELGARGRTVGVITHVRELAERLPVRFEVRKGPAGSTVQRLEVGEDLDPVAPHAWGDDPTATATSAGGAA